MMMGVASPCRCRRGSCARRPEPDEAAEGQNQPLQGRLRGLWRRQPRDLPSALSSQLPYRLALGNAWHNLLIRIVTANWKP